MADPGPALVDFFADTRIAPAYGVAPSSRHETDGTPTPKTVTLTFRPAGETPATVDELADARRELLKVGNTIVRFRDTVDETWTYLADNPQKRRSWIGFLAFGDEEELDELEADLSAYEEELLTRLLEDMFSALWPDEATDGDEFRLYEELDEVLQAFPASVAVKPDGEVVEAIGFNEAEDGYVIAAEDISRTVAELLEGIVSPNFARYWASVDLESLFRGSQGIPMNDEDGCDRDCQLNEILARPFAVRPAEASDIAAELERALTPLGEYRLRWIRRR